jgi:hypothetical protein
MAAPEWIIINKLRRLSRDHALPSTYCLVIEAQPSWVRPRALLDIERLSKTDVEHINILLFVEGVMRDSCESTGGKMRRFTNY